MELYDEVVEVKKKPRGEGRPNVEKIAQAKAVVEQIDDSERTTTKRPSSSLPRKKSIKPAGRMSSESESSDSATEDGKAIVDGFDYRQWESLDVPAEIKDLYQYIARYSAPKYELKYQLMPFIPDYIPAVGDIDAFLKVIPPDPFTKESKLPEFIPKLGLEVLDEPCGDQSDPALLHMKLRAASTTSNRAPAPPPSIAKTPKDVEKWISEVQALHADQPYPMVTHSRPLPDIDALMTEWPSKMEHVLNSVGFPSAQLDCSLKFYIELMCGLLDIPLPPTNNQVDYLFALNTLFNLYLAVKNPME